MVETIFGGRLTVVNSSGIDAPNGGVEAAVDCCKAVAVEFVDVTVLPAIGTTILLVVVIVVAVEVVKLAAIVVVPLAIAVVPVTTVLPADDEIVVGVIGTITAEGDCAGGVGGKLGWLDTDVITGCGVDGAGDGVVGGATRGDSGGCCESSSIEPAAPCAWL